MTEKPTKKLLYVDLPKTAIDKIFATAETQQDYLIGLYKLAFANVPFDNIEKVNGWPATSKQTAEYIWRKAMDFDGIHHPNVVRGGLWMNNGFTVVETMPDWVVEQCDYTLMDDENG